MGDGGHEEVEVFFGEIEFGGGGGIIGEDAVVEGAFFLLQGKDFLFDGAAGDEFVDEDGIFLADAVGAVGGLVFERRDSTRGRSG